MLTSIRLENRVWDILAEMAEAEAEHCTTNSLIVQFHDEILAHRGEVPNFASFLRVTGMRFLRRKLTEAERAIGGTGAALPNAAAKGAVSKPSPASATPLAPTLVPMAARS